MVSDATLDDANTQDATRDARQDANTGDASPADASPADASLDAVVDSIWTEPWSSRTLWVRSTMAYDCGPSLSADGTELYFISSRTDGVAGNSVFVSRFESGDWTPPTAVTPVNLADMHHVRISPTGLELFTSRAGAVGTDVYVSTRADTDASWSAPMLVDASDDATGLNFEGITGVPSLFDNGRKAVFHFDLASPDDHDLYLVERSNAGAPWGTAQIIDSLTSIWREESPWVSEDGRHLYFTSNRRPNNWDNSGDANIYYARGDGMGGFDAPVLVPEVNAAPSVPVGMTWDEDFTVRADGRLAFMCANENDMGRMYMLTR